MVQPQFDYSSPLWYNCCELLKDKLQKFQSRAARVITGASQNIRLADVLDALSWQTLELKRAYNKSVFMYKILNNHAASNLKESFSKRSVLQNINNLRNNNSNSSLLRPKRDCLKKSFKYSGAILWNNLSQKANLSKTIYVRLRYMMLGHAIFYKQYYKKGQLINYTYFYNIIIYCHIF